MVPKTEAIANMMRTEMPQVATEAIPAMEGREK